MDEFRREDRLEGIGDMCGVVMLMKDEEVRRRYVSSVMGR